MSLTIRRGTVLDDKLTYLDANKAPIDITGWQVNLKSRDDPATLDWSTANGKIDISAGNGVIQFTVSNADTAALALTSGEIYLSMTDLLGATRLKLEGPFVIRDP